MKRSQQLSYHCIVETIHLHLCISACHMLLNPSLYSSQLGSCCICYGLNVVLLQNLENWFNFYFLLSCIHYHDLEQWQVKLKPVEKTLNQGKI